MTSWIILAMKLFLSWGPHLKNSSLRVWSRVPSSRTTTHRLNSFGRSKQMGKCPFALLWSRWIVLMGRQAQPKTGWLLSTICVPGTVPRHGPLNGQMSVERRSYSIARNVVNGPSIFPSFSSVSLFFLQKPRRSNWLVCNRRWLLTRLDGWKILLSSPSSSSGDQCSTRRPRHTMHITHRSSGTMDAGSLVHENYSTGQTSCTRYDRCRLCPVGPKPHKGLLPIRCDYSGRGCSHCSIGWYTRRWPPDQGDHRPNWKPLESLFSWSRTPWTY